MFVPKLESRIVILKLVDDGWQTCVNIVHYKDQIHANNQVTPQFCEFLLLTQLQSLS
jgi:hypothetical protein